MPSPPTCSTAGIFQSHHKITVESLCCEANDAGHTYGFTAFPTSDGALTQATRHELERSRTTINRPSPGTIYSQQRSGLILPTHPIRGAEDPSIIDMDTALHHDRSRSMVVPPITDLLTTAGSSDVLCIDHVADDRVQPTEKTASDKLFQHTPRPARPAYTEEQKFFIMYYRIIRKLSWPEIEDRFANFFHLRTKDGLTSVYYRIRKDWHMEEVLKTNSSTTDDRETVKERATNFRAGFLRELT